MRRLAIISLAMLIMAFGTVSRADAGTASGTTTILGPSAEAPDYATHSGKARAYQPTDVKVTITTGAPVVPYVYSIVNKCWFSGKTSGPSDTFERFDLAGPWFDNDGEAATVDPYMIVAVNLNPVPADGTKCKMAIYKNNTAVQGSSKTYSVVP